MFSFIYAWTNSWANKGDAVDWRGHRAHYDVTVWIRADCYWPYIIKDQSMRSANNLIICIVDAWKKIEIQQLMFLLLLIVNVIGADI